MTSSSKLPVAIIGAGPIGLAAAANLIERGMTPLILEAGERVAASMWDWGHVRLFTPWSFLIDPASQRLLEEEGGWTLPDQDYVPYSKEVVEGYLDKVARLKSFAPHIHLQHRITSVARDGHDRMKDGSREDAPFLIVASTPDGPARFKARAVIDASGTWTTPNPMGASGVLADGESEHASHVRYGIPDVLGRERDRYVGKRVLVVGSGHSAIGTILNLVELTEDEPDTQIVWAVRKDDPTRLWGGGKTDQLAARGALGTRVHAAVHSGPVTLLTGLSISGMKKTHGGLQIIGVDGTAHVEVDEVVVATGSRPDLKILQELRLDLDIATESTRALGPMIDPNHHSCGSVKPHGEKELRHPESGFYMVGMKSYGRAPTFLLRTGYEQVRSVVAGLAGDMEAASRIELTLPSTGVCSTDLAFKDANGEGRMAGCC